MAEIDFKIVMTGIAALAAIYITLIICGRDTEVIGSMIVGVIALGIGVLVPTPKIDNQRGVLTW